eukprot:1347019-Pyramimonas_sp.AAC.1
MVTTFMFALSSGVDPCTDQNGMIKEPGAFASPPTPVFACTLDIFMSPVGSNTMLKMVPFRSLYDFTNALPF